MINPARTYVVYDKVTKTYISYLNGVVNDTVGVTPYDFEHLMIDGVEDVYIFNPPLTEEEAKQVWNEIALSRTKG